MTDKTSLLEKQVIRRGLCSMQVCVPEDTADAEVEEFANAENPTGISSRWRIRREGDESLLGARERVACQQRFRCVHIMLDC